MSVGIIDCCWLYFSWSPNSTCLHLDFYLLSWWWQPLWSGGLLYRWLLPQQKAYWIHFFLQNILSMYILSMTQQKAGQKTDTNPKKNLFLQFYLIRSWSISTAGTTSGTSGSTGPPGSSSPTGPRQCSQLQLPWSSSSWCSRDFLLELIPHKRKLAQASWKIPTQWLLTSKKYVLNP